MDNDLLFDKIQAMAAGALQSLERLAYTPGDRPPSTVDAKRALVELGILAAESKARTALYDAHLAELRKAGGA